MRPLASALSRALSHPENARGFGCAGAARLWSLHRIFAWREEVENALFKWLMTLRDRGSGTVAFLSVFRRGDHWHIGWLNCGRKEKHSEQTYGCHQQGSRRVTIPTYPILPHKNRSISLT